CCLGERNGRCPHSGRAQHNSGRREAGGFTWSFPCSRADPEARTFGRRLCARRLEQRKHLVNWNRRQTSRCVADAKTDNEFTLGERHSGTELDSVTRESERRRDGG